MLPYLTCFEIDNSSTLDKVLDDGDALYRTIINNLKADGKFIHSLLSLDEIPDIFEVGIGKFIVQKQYVISGILVDTHEEHGLPTLHYVLNSALTSVSSGLLTIGAICSAVFKKNGLYLFFDSHSHGQNGLSSVDSASIIISFSSQDDLVTYLYAFYDSMKIDLSLQFDCLPINVRKSNKEQSSKAQLESCLETYFKDQKLQQARKAQSQVGCLDVPTETSGAKKKKRNSRTEHYKMVKRNQSGNKGVLAKEYAKKKLARQNPAFKASEKEHQCTSKQKARKKPGVLENERTAKAIARKKRGVLAKESADKKLARQNPAFKASENEHQRASKQKVRKKPGVLAKESAEKKLARQNPTFKASENKHQRALKQKVRKKPGVLAKESAEKKLARQNPTLKASEKEHQRASKQKARKNPG